MESPGILLSAVRRSMCQRCISRCASLSFEHSTAPSRPFSTTRARAVFPSRPRSQLAGASEAEDLPRWQSTPAAMVAPVRTRPRPEGREHKVNNDPRKLDKFYHSFLGESHSELQLSDEVRWLAVTHKSFDHGRRGFNDRLAFLGKRIVDLQISLALTRVREPRADRLPPPSTDSFQRPIFYDHRLHGLAQVTERNKQAVADKKRLAQLAESYGAQHVIRWKPRKAENLYGSGISSVLAQALYAVVGAISLEKGSLAADSVVKDRVLKPLGL